MAALNPVNKTLLYSDIFDYPLTLPQIWKYLITNRKVSQGKVEKLLINSNIRHKNSFYYLQGRLSLVELRIKREKESLKKVKLAINIVKKLKYIPSIKLLAISGSLSMKNADKEDDIDLFVIAEKNLIWSTRFLIIMILKLFNVYRSRSEIDSANKFCLNMLIDENNLNFPKEKQNIYSAHEIVQIQPLFNRSKSYEKFLDSNGWIKKYLANFESDIIPDSNLNILNRLLVNLWLLLRIEIVLELIQKKYMGQKKGAEIVRPGFLAFHPNDYGKSVINAYKSRL